MFLVRHPVPHITSGYAALSTLGMSVSIADEDLAIFCSQRYQRLLFDHFFSQNRTPLVVDADELLFHTARVTAGLARGLYLDTSLFSAQWDPMPDDQRLSDPIMRAWMETFHTSTGIERPVHEDERDVEVAYGRWKEKWGGKVAETLKGLVAENTRHYEYLAGFKVWQAVGAL